MNRTRFLISTMIGLSILSAACQTATPIPQQIAVMPTQAVNTPVKVVNPPAQYPIETTNPAPSATPRSEPTDTPAAPTGTGSIHGKLGYPSETVPAMRIFAYQVGTDAYYFMETRMGTSEYVMEGLGEGNYIVIAFTIGGNGFPEGLKQGYTIAVICGLGETCNDHTLAEVSVKAGQVTESIDLTDSLADDSNTPAHSKIEGRLSYPSEFIPPLHVVAYRLEDNKFFYVNTGFNQNQYILPVPAGTYDVVAYVGGVEATHESPSAGYSQAVLCGLMVECTDHSLVDVVVERGLETVEINPGDWYAPEGTFPPSP